MRFNIALFFILFSLEIQAQKVSFIQNEKAKKVEILVDNQPFTAYFYPDASVLKKPVLYPIRSSQGTLLTRGWPLDPRAGERVDHPHHVGMWLNYEDVNGDDFWNNSNTPPNPKASYGTIIHTGIQKIKGGKQGILAVTADWMSSKNAKVLEETTTYVFAGSGNQRTIERTTRLKALGEKVVFKDVKDGMIAMRLTRELEIPSTKPDIFTDASGVATAVPKMDNTGITGNYHSSNGIDGEKVWGTRGNWMSINGKIQDEDLSITIIDHPKNVGYPTYWHARGYGLFSANPLGQSVFSNGKEVLNFTLNPNQSVTFKYKIVIASEKMTDEVLNKMAVDFAKK